MADEQMTREITNAKIRYAGFVTGPDGAMRIETVIDKFDNAGDYVATHTIAGSKVHVVEGDSSP